VAGSVGATASSAQTFQVGNTGYNGNVTFAGTVALGSSTSNAMSMATYGTGTVSINGTSGTSTIGALSVNGGSTFAFGPGVTANTGTVAVNASRFNVGSSAHISTGAFTSNAGTVAIGSNAVVTTGNVQQTGGTTTLASGSSVTTGTVAVGSGGTITVNSGATLNTGNVSVASAAALTVNGTVNTVGNLTTALGTSLSIATGGLVSVVGNATFAGSVYGPASGAGTLSVAGGGNTLTFNTSINASNLTLKIGGSSGNALLVELGGTLVGGVGSYQNQLTFGTIEITGDTILDFGDSAGTFLSSTNLIIDSGANVTVKGWSTTANNGTNNTAANSTIWYVLASQTGTGVASGGLVGGSAGNLSLATGGTDDKNVVPLTQITFEDPHGSIGDTTTWVDGFHDGWFDHEIRPTPEPSTYGAIFMAACLGILGFREVRRRRATKSAQS